MRRALRLAARGAGQVSPNPKVGAVVVQDGRVVGEGWHRRYGGPHAEVHALDAAGDATRGATVYVTLEPCDHEGKTPPCTRALVDAGVARVVHAIDDPNPVAAGGAARLRAHGIQVTGGVLADEAARLNAPFLFAARGARRPFVTLKLALSIDGALVGAARRRHMLTGPAAQREVHRLRADSDAVAVGSETAIVDDAALTVRGVRAPARPPVRVVFDRRGRLPAESRLVRTAGDAPVVLLTSTAGALHAAPLAAAGVTIVASAGLEDALERLRAAGVQSLLVEGGAGLASALVEAGLVDRLIIFQAPVVLGEGALPAFPALSSSRCPVRFRVQSRRVLGDDLMTVYEPAPADPGTQTTD